MATKLLEQFLDESVVIKESNISEERIQKMCEAIDEFEGLIRKNKDHLKVTNKALDRFCVDKMEATPELLLDYTTLLNALAKYYAGGIKTDEQGVHAYDEDYYNRDNLNKSILSHPTVKRWCNDEELEAMAKEPVLLQDQEVLGKLKKSKIPLIVMMKGDGLHGDPTHQITEGVLNEADQDGTYDDARAKQYAQAIQNLMKTFQASNLPGVMNSLNGLKNKVLQSALQKAPKVGEPMPVQQLQMFTQQIENMKSAMKAILPLLQDENLSDEDKDTIEKYLIGSMNKKAPAPGGMFAKIKNWFKTPVQSFAGLDTNSVVSQIMDLAKDENGVENLQKFFNLIGKSPTKVVAQISNQPTTAQTPSATGQNKPQTAAQAQTEKPALKVDPQKVASSYTQIKQLLNRTDLQPEAQMTQLINLINGVVA